MAMSEYTDWKRLKENWKGELEEPFLIDLLFFFFFEEKYLGYCIYLIDLN